MANTTGEGTLCGLVYRQGILWVMRCDINQCYDWFMEMRSSARRMTRTTHIKDQAETIREAYQQRNPPPPPN